MSLSPTDLQIHHVIVLSVSVSFTAAVVVFVVSAVIQSCGGETESVSTIVSAPSAWLSLLDWWIGYGKEWNCTFQRHTVCYWIKLNASVYRSDGMGRAPFKEHGGGGTTILLNGEHSIKRIDSVIRPQSDSAFLVWQFLFPVFVANDVVTDLELCSRSLTSLFYCTKKSDFYRQPPLDYIDYTSRAFNQIKVTILLWDVVPHKEFH